MDRDASPPSRFLVFDFDGVFTDNFVYTSTAGHEMVRSSRSDSYALSNFMKDRRMQMYNLFIVSTEENGVVKRRARKLKLKAYTGVSSKKEFMDRLFISKKLDTETGWARTIYVGNDLNDFECINLAGASFAPIDAHPKIKEIASKVFDSRGGNGFVREVLEYLQTVEYLEKENRNP